MCSWWKRKNQKPLWSVPDPADYGINREDAQPEPERTPSMPEVNPPKEKDATVFYRFGVTDNDRISLQIGYSEITMNRRGCQNLIDQLTFFMNQLPEEEMGNEE